LTAAPTRVAHPPNRPGYEPSAPATATDAAGADDRTAAGLPRRGGSAILRRSAVRVARPERTVHRDGRPLHTEMSDLPLS
jgi:hypothetical protein